MSFWVVSSSIERERFNDVVCDASRSTAVLNEEVDGSCLDAGVVTVTRRDCVIGIGAKALAVLPSTARREMARRRRRDDDEGGTMSLFYVWIKNKE